MCTRVVLNAPTYISSTQMLWNCNGTSHNLFESLCFVAVLHGSVRSTQLRKPADDFSESSPTAVPYLQIVALLSSKIMLRLPGSRSPPRSFLSLDCNNR